jgi:hypothetical protein
MLMTGKLVYMVDCRYDDCSCKELQILSGLAITTTMQRLFVHLCSHDLGVLLSQFFFRMHYITQAEEWTVIITCPDVKT